MPRIERAKNPTLEQIQQAQAQHRLIMETPQIPPFDQGNLSVLMDHLEKVASLENRRQKAKLAGDSERIAELRATQQKLAQSESARLLQRFELIRWGRILAGSLAQGVVLSLVMTLLYLALARTWNWSLFSLFLITPPILWITVTWSLAPPVLGGSPSPKRARKLARALSRRTETAGFYSLVARPWLTAVILWKLPRQLWQAYQARKPKKK